MFNSSNQELMMTELLRFVSPFLVLYSLIITESSQYATLSNLSRQPIRARVERKDGRLCVCVSLSQ